MTSKVLVIVATEAEAAHVANTDDVIVFVSSLNAMTLPKKMHGKRIQLNDFVFQHEAKFKELYQENDITCVCVYAPANLSGICFCSYWYQALWAKPAAYMGHSSVNFINYAHVNALKDHLDNLFVEKAGTITSTYPEQALDLLYQYRVMLTSVSSYMQKHVHAKLARKVFGNQKRQLSFGLNHVLSGIMQFENPRTAYINYICFDNVGRRSGTWAPDPVNGIPLRWVKNDTGGFSTVPCLPTTGKLHHVRSGYHAVSGYTRVPGYLDTLETRYDPYLHCLNAGISLSKYNDMIGHGWLTVPVPDDGFGIDDLDSDSSLKQIMKALDLQNQSLTKSGIFTGSEFRNLHGLVNESINLNIKMACNCVGTCTDDVSSDSDYMSLFDRYFTKTAMSLYEFGGRAVRVQVTQEYADQEHAVYDGMAIDTSKDNHYGWLRVVDQQQVLRARISDTNSEQGQPDSVPVHSVEIGDSYKAQAPVFAMLQAYLGYTPEYVFDSLRKLAKRKLIKISGTGFRITSYGYAVASEYERALTDVMDFDVVSKLLNIRYDAIAHGEFSCFGDPAGTVTDKPVWADAGRKAHQKSKRKRKDVRPSTGPVFDNVYGSTDSVLEKVYAYIDTQVDKLPEYEPTCITRKNKRTGKRVRYYMRIRNNMAWFETKSGKKVPVHAKVKSSTYLYMPWCSSEVACISSVPVPARTKSLALLKVHDQGCLECGLQEYGVGYDNETGQEHWTCSGCGSIRQPVFFTSIDQVHDNAQVKAQEINQEADEAVVAKSINKKPAHVNHGMVVLASGTNDVRGESPKIAKLKKSKPSKADLHKAAVQLSKALGKSVAVVSKTGR